MHTPTLQEMKDFIMAQPDEKFVNLYDGSASGVGCILVHYCKEKGIDFTFCVFNYAKLGNTRVLEIADEKSLLDLWDMKYDQECAITNYGELKLQLLDIPQDDE